MILLYEMKFYEKSPNYYFIPRTSYPNVTTQSPQIQFQGGSTLINYKAHAPTHTTHSARILVFKFSLKP